MAMVTCIKNERKKKPNVSQDSDSVLDASNSGLSASAVPASQVKFVLYTVSSGVLMSPF